jgi:hypothetical protein
MTSIGSTPPAGRSLTPRSGKGARTGLGTGRLATLLLLTAASAPLRAQSTTGVQVPPAAGQDSTRTASVTYLAGQTVYVSAGRADGLTEAQEVSLIRGDSVAATLKVQFLSSKQSACEVIRGASDIVVGEVIHYQPQATASAAPGVAVAHRYTVHRLSGPGLHGRVGLRYLVAQTEPSIGGFSQPSGDLRLDGMDLGGTPLGLAVDLRTRRTTTSSGTGPSSVDGHTRVYQAALLFNSPGDGFRMSVGRQYLTAVTSVSLFDGGLMEVGGSHLTVGAFGGMEPDPLDLGLSSTIKDYGGYLQLHNKAGAFTPWLVSVGGVGSYSQGGANREFGFLQASVSSRVFSFYGLQELDYYRPWKVKQGEQTWSLSSAYVSASLRPARWLAFRSSWDNRRNVRTYLVAVNPAIAFDDSHRQGLSGGISLLGHRVRASADVRQSSGGTSGDQTSWTGTVGFDRLTPLHLGLSGRGTWYNGPGQNGQLYSGRLGGDVWSWLHLDLQTGVQDETGISPRHNTWYGLDVDVSLARAWFLSLSGSRERSAGVTTSTLFSSLTWRF